MSDKYVNQTGLQYFYNRIKTIFATQTALGDLSDRVDDIISEGGEPNVIEVVQENGTPLTVTNKTVNVTVPTTVAELSDSSDYALAEDVPTKTSDLTNDGNGQSPYATQEYVGQNGGKIDTISVNGAAQTITNKNVDITVPTAVSDLTNDSGYQTASDVASAIDTAVASAYKYKGSVATQADLPASPETGDVYDVQETGMNYAWDGSSWDALGQLIDASTLWSNVSGQNNSLIALTTAEIDTIVDGA